MDVNMINSLLLMGKGMVAIFVVILVIYLAVLILHRATNRKSS